MEDLTVDPDPDGYTRCTSCKRWQWCARPTDEKPQGCDADEHGERVSNRYYRGTGEQA